MEPAHPPHAPDPAGPGEPLEPQDLKLRGLDISPGVAVGRAFVLDAGPVEPKETVIPAGRVEAELRLLREAVAQAAAELKVQSGELEAVVGSREAQIPLTHIAILQDRKGLVPEIERVIVEERVDARTASRKASARLAERLAALGDPVLRERDVDLRDVAQRLVAQLSRRLRGEPSARGPVILVARELYPTHAALLKKGEILGIVTEVGGRTSHAAILARSLGIPAVTGIEQAARRIRPGTMVILDGTRGEVLLNPGPAALRAYGDLHREQHAAHERLRGALHLPAATADGEPVHLLANVDRLEDADPEVLRASAGIGLFRTEYFFMARTGFPTEEEQVRHYRQVLERVGPGKEVVLRTLDIGGDKMLSYFGIPHEENPFLGLRSIRLSFEHPEIFRTQLRAMLRASAHGKVKILFPMITTLVELRQANRAVEEAKEELRREGRDFDPALRVGFLVEVPAAAISIRHFLPEADYANVGTNDLIQYAMAVDRSNPKIAYLYEPLHPAILGLLRLLAAEARRAGKEMTVCGEMGGNADYALLLLGLGFRRFSVSCYNFPAFKEMVRKVRIPEAVRAARRALRLATAGEVAASLRAAVERLGGGEPRGARPARGRVKAPGGGYNPSPAPPGADATP